MTPPEILNDDGLEDLIVKRQILRETQRARRNRLQQTVDYVSGITTLLLAGVEETLLEVEGVSTDVE